MFRYLDSVVIRFFKGNSPWLQVARTAEPIDHKERLKEAIKNSYNPSQIRSLETFKMEVDGEAGQGNKYKMKDPR